MAVQIGETWFPAVIPGVDQTIDEALYFAALLDKRLKEQRQDGTQIEIRAAVVNCFDGLVLLDDSPEHAKRGIHLSQAVCYGSSPAAMKTINILEMFGFGRDCNLNTVVTTKRHHVFNRS